MKSFSLDSSCMIAAVCLWHEQQEAVARSVERRLSLGMPLLLAGHALLETYAVLTRLPSPHRLSGADAWYLLEQNFVSRATVLGCDGESYAALLASLASNSVTGGRSYDLLIATVVSSIGHTEFLTLNPRHFNHVPRGIIVIDPGTES